MQHPYPLLRLRPLALTILFALVAIPAAAYDFFMVDSIYYHITSDFTVEVRNSHNYSGAIAIPETVTYSDVTYSVTSIGDYAFGGTSLTSIEIPNSVTSIGDYAFDGCFSLTSVTLGSSVTSIGYDAFCDCTSLTSIEIPNSVTSIGDYAFSGCSSLTSIAVDSANECYSSYDGVLYSKDMTTLIQCPEGKTSVTFHSSVTTIGKAAFRGCASLTSIEIPNSVTSIEARSFMYCDSLTSIEIPNSVVTIGDEAFEGCESLTSVTLGNSVTTIGEEAFYNCYSLLSVTLGNSVTTIGDKAFGGGCYSLTSIAVDSANECYSSYDGVLYSKDMTTLILCPRGKTSAIIHSSVTSIGDEAFESCYSLTSIDLPNSVTTIGNEAFSYCTSLTSVTLGSSVTSIGYDVFCDCTSLTSIEIPNSVTSIGDYAFDGCSSLTSVTLGSSVASIGDYAFSYCTSLTSLTSLNPVPPTCESYYADWSSSAFEDVDTKTCVLYVPEGSKEIYAATSPWSDFLNIVEIDVTSVESVTLTRQTERTVVSRYNLDGKTGANGGIQIVKYSDGTTEKVYVK